MEDLTVPPRAFVFVSQPTRRRRASAEVEVSALLSELGVDSTAPDALDLLDALQLAELVEVARSDARVAEVVSGMAPYPTRARENLDLVLDPER